MSIWKISFYAKLIIYFFPYWRKIFSRASTKLFQLEYASISNHWYLIKRHNISIIFNSGEYVGKKKRVNPFSFHSSCFCKSALLVCIEELSRTNTVFFSKVSQNLSIQAITTSLLILYYWKSKNPYTQRNSKFST